MAMITQEDLWLLTLHSYEEYIDTFRTKEDLIYIRDNKYTRMISQLGYGSTGSVYSPQQFEERRKIIKEAMVPPKISSFFFDDKDSFTDPILRELAQRQIANYQKIITTIIFICYRSKVGFDITGYIDFEDSLRKANQKKEDALDWRGIFAGKKKIVPKRTDLSYHNWKTGAIYYNDSSNYEIQIQKPCGVNFMYKGDRKVVCTNPWSEYNESGAQRTYFFSEKYNYLVLYDYLIRRKL